MSSAVPLRIFFQNNRCVSIATRKYSSIMATIIYIASVDELTHQEKRQCALHFLLVNARSRMSQAFQNIRIRSSLPMLPFSSWSEKVQTDSNQHSTVTLNTTSCLFLIWGGGVGWSSDRGHVSILVLLDWIATTCLFIKTQPFRVTVSYCVNNSDCENSLPTPQKNSHPRTYSATKIYHCVNFVKLELNR